MKKIFYNIFCIAALLGLISCGDFLDRPSEDSYNADNYYQTDAQCIAGVNYLYSSPWYDFQRGYFKVGEILSGNLYEGSSPYLDFTVNGSDEHLKNMSNSFWSVVAHCNTVYNSIKNSSGSITQSVRNQCMGECLTWKAMAYFYLVRTFGDVPIIHDNTQELESGTYNSVQKVKRADVYEYIVMTLRKAMSLLSKDPTSGHIGKYQAEALLAKVFLTMSGVSGSKDAALLDSAATHALNVKNIFKDGLLPNYSDNFRLANNINQESLIAWRWTANGSVWTAQNTLQSDLGLQGFDEFGDTWGDWTDPSVSLQQAFGIDLASQTPDTWINNVDTRLKATMMLPGFTYSYFWQDQGGFDYLAFIYDTDYNSSAKGKLESATGANCVKHLYGNANDHVLGAGHSAAYMYSSLATHLLRLSDVYLILAEAKMGTGTSTSDADALDAFYQVRHRAISTYEKPTSITLDEVWKERRLELALEGDRWYDYVRRSYYDPEGCIEELSQPRRVYWNLSDCYKNYYESGTWDNSKVSLNTDYNVLNPSALMKKDPDTGKSYLCLPFPTEDVTFNPNLGSSVDGVHVDVYSTYSYD